VKPYLDDGDVTLWHGEALDVLRAMPAESVDCCVCSPPYWGLRSYLDNGHPDKALEIGLEDTPEAFVARLVDVFREVRRVLAPHGTCWVVLGDSYAGGSASQGGDGATSGLKRDGRPEDGRVACAVTHQNRMLVQDTPVKRAAGLKPKDLVGIPWRVAFALQADGWWLRSDVVWSKPNPMPESVTDRPTKAHEYVFLLTKAPRYYWDAEAVKEESQERAPWSPVSDKQGVTGMEAMSTSAGRRYTGFNARYLEQMRNGTLPAGRNIRSVWSIATQPFPEAHFATFPEELVRRTIAAGCPERVCRTCGEPSRRVVEVESRPNWNGDGQKHDGTYYRPNIGGGVGNDRREKRDHGWSDCGHDDYRPGRVLDPFVGSGTTCHVARKMGRHAWGIDLSEDYLGIAARRLAQLSLLGGA
jgi:DNA modification methylase